MSEQNQNAGHSPSAPEKKGFTGSVGYVMAVAGSAVGLGNIWRFPYLAAKYGGGTFLLVYLILLVTFGYPLIISETALGRMTGKSPVGAFGTFGKGPHFKFGGWINAIVPMLIAPYYCVIGGWVIKYLFEYIVGNSQGVMEDGYFGNFIASPMGMEVCFLVFAVMVIAVVFCGIVNGVEKTSMVMMPILLVLAVVIAVYSMTRPGAMEGVKYFLIPDWSQFSLLTVGAALGQLFFSLSIAMGILYTYGSYIQQDVDIEKTTKQVAIFDTSVALLAGLMIIPAVFAFSGGDADALNSGPSLMFITIPKVFASMGMGGIVGVAFFLMVLFAALTSAISLMETGVATFQDQTGWSRNKCGVLMSFVILAVGTLCAFGFNLWDFIQPFGMSVLDFLDFITNSIMMPIGALCTCLLIVRVVGRKKIGEEIKASSPFQLQKMYNFSIAYLAPICLIVILLLSVGNVLGWITI